MELNFNSDDNPYQYILKLLEQEKYQRQHNNIIKQLEITIKIVLMIIIYR